MSNEKDELREHSFDGIQEYDNDLPKWWLWLFAITIVVSIIYPFIYDFGPGEFASESIAKELDDTKAQQQTTTTEVSESSLLKLASDASAISSGKEIFVTRCVACHGAQGQGLIGPNLTDDYWIHGAKITEIHSVVENGVLEKGMLAWKQQLAPEQLNAVVAYIWTLHGTNPTNPKAPEGNKVER